MKSTKLLILAIFCTLFYGTAFCYDPYPWRFEGICQGNKELPLDLISAFLPKEPVIFEAGGHYGLDTQKFVDKWPSSYIISFEPNPNAFQKLVELSLKKDNIYPYPLALANFNGPGIFYVCHGTNGTDPQFEGASSLLPASEGMKIHYMGPQISVNCVILDDWCKENQINKIDFMWLDLEGMELQALKSSPQILKTVSVIYTETNFQEFRIGMTQYSALRKFLEDSGFLLISHWYLENLQGNAIFVRNR